MSASPIRAHAAAGRKTVLCPHCGLNQFRMESGRCRRCRQPLTGNCRVCKNCRSAYPPEVVPLDDSPMQQIAVNPVEFRGEMFDEATACVLKLARLARGLSQFEMARVMGCPRTYISKVENGHARPVLRSLQRWASALNLPLDGLVGLIEVTAAVWKQAQGQGAGGGTQEAAQQDAAGRTQEAAR